MRQTKTAISTTNLVTLKRHSTWAFLSSQPVNVTFYYRLNQIIKYATGIFILPGIVIVIAPASSIVARGESIAGPDIIN